MKKLQVVIFIAIGACSIAYSFGQTQQPNGSSKGTLSEAALRKILADTCNQVNAFYKAEHFPVMAPSPDFCGFRYQGNRDNQGLVGQFIPEEKAMVSARIVASSGRFTMFSNDASFDAYVNSPLHETQLPPKWTEAHVIEVATKFADIFAKPWGACLGKPHTRFGWNGTSFDKKTGKPCWIPGMWTVDWYEQTPSGIPYVTGAMTVVLSEQYGPFDTFLSFPPPYEDEHITPISKDKALIAAREGLDNILAWEPAKAALGNVQVLDNPAPNIGLMIVQPNGMTKQDSILSALVSTQVKSRLGWVVSYHIIASTGNGSGKIDVYIDAKDGSFLGGYL